jgi:RNA polymerase sigma-70 factor (ECF subfamily)
VTTCEIHQQELTESPMLDVKTERLTIKRAQRGDRDAISELIKAYQRPLEAFLFRLCGKSDLAEDLSQEAFVRVIRSLDRFDERFRFSTWLFTIGKRLLVNHQQKMRPTADSELVQWRAGTSATPFTETVEIERGQRVQAMLTIALDALVSPQREIVLLFHQQGWPVQRISEELRMPEGTVKSHLFRARRRMLEAIEMSGFACPLEVFR